MSCSHLEKMDPRVRRTRKLLQDALHSLLGEKTYSAISVQDISERATVNRATFYAHYPDKQSLLKSTIQADFQEYMFSRMDCLPPMSADSLESVFTAIIEFVGGLAGGCPAAAKEMGGVAETAIQEEINGMFRHWLEFKGKPEQLADHSIGTLSTVFSWSIYGAASRWSHGSRKRAPAEVAKSVVALLLPRVLVTA